MLKENELDKIIEKMCPNDILDSDYWVKIGYKLAGPIVLKYCQYINNAIVKNKFDCILFVARDGWLLCKYFKKLNAEINVKYVYAPRIISHLVSSNIEYNKKNKEEILQYYCKNDDEIRKSLTDYQKNNQFLNRDFFEENRVLIERKRKETLQKYKKYIAGKIGISKRPAIVDTVTYAFSSQELIENASQIKVTGIYWAVINSYKKFNYKYLTFAGSDQSTQDDERIYTKNWNLIEFLITSPEYPVIDIKENGEPIFSKCQNQNEINRVEIFKKIEKGVEIFFKSLTKKDFNRFNEIGFDKLVKYINKFIKNPSKIDFDHFKNIEFAIDSNHLRYIPLFCIETKTLDYILNPRITSKKLMKCQWVSVYQKVYLLILNPLYIKIHGLKLIRIVFFPSLRINIFSLKLSIGLNNLEIKIGRGLKND